MVGEAICSGSEWNGALLAPNSSDTIGEGSIMFMEAGGAKWSSSGLCVHLCTRHGSTFHFKAARAALSTLGVMSSTVRHRRHHQHHPRERTIASHSCISLVFGMFSLLLRRITRFEPVGLECVRVSFLVDASTVTGLEAQCPSTAPRCHVRT